MGEIDIKLIWKSGDDQPTNYPKEAIDAIVRQGPNNIVQRFVKTLRIEQKVNVISLVMVTIIMIIRQSWLLAAGLTAFNIGTFYYYRQLVKRLDVNVLDFDVISYLMEMQRIIHKFMSHYRIFIILLLIPAYWLSLKVIERLTGVSQIWTQTNYHIANAGIIGLLVVISFICLHWMYGKKSQRLKTMIRALRAEES